MRGLLFSILFCAASLLFAESLATLLVKLSIIEIHDFDEVHDLIMLILLALYMGYAPSFPKDFEHHHKKDDTNKLIKKGDGGIK